MHCAIGITASALLLSVQGVALAQGAADYPAKPVTIVVPFGPGASVDIETRLYAGKLSEQMGRQFVVEYRAGAGGTIGTAYVARAPADGHTLLTITSSFTGAPALYKNLAYDPIRDFSGVSLMSKRTGVILVHPSVPYTNVAEFLAYARANPGKINVSTTGAGGTPHLNAEWLHNMTRTQVTFVHYKGSSSGLTDLMAGRVQVTYATLLSGMAHIKSGKVRALAIASAERSPSMPLLPTVQEQGVPGYDYASWLAIAAPNATPAAIVNRLSAELGKVAKMPDVMQRLEADGGILIGGSPGALNQLIASESARWRKLVADADIKLEE